MQNEWVRATMKSFCLKQGSEINDSRFNQGQGRFGGLAGIPLPNPPLTASAGGKCHPFRDRYTKEDANYNGGEAKLVTSPSHPKHC